MPHTLTHAADPELQALIEEIGAELETPEPGQKRAIAYLRVSTEEQKAGYGLSYTGKRVLRHIKKKGHALVGIYADGGFSGSLEAHQRPDLTRLMEAAREDRTPFDIVCVAEARAIGRRDRAFWPWVWELEDLGVFTNVVKGDYDNSTAEGRSRMRKDADRAEDERETIRDRTQGGIQEKAEDGLYPGGKVPFGWTIAEQGKKGVSYYAVHQAEAATLHRARELFLVKRSWREAAASLNSEQLLTRSGRPWTAKNLRSRLLGANVLENQLVYRGSSAHRDEDGNPIYGESVTIELPEIFTAQQAQDLRAAAAGRRPARPTRQRVYLLSHGLLISPCGNRYEGHQHRPDEVIYRCKGHQESYAGAEDQCSCPGLEATGIERQVWADVVDILTDADRMKAMAQDWIDATADKRVDHTKRIAELDQQIAELEDTINVATTTTARRSVRRGMSKPEVQEAVTRAVFPLEQELEGLEKLRNEAEAWQREATEATRRLQGLERVAEAARKNLKGIEPALKAELLELMGLQAKVTRCAPRRLGVACAIRQWFIDNGRDVPLLTDEGWERIKPLMGGSRSTLDRRAVVEAMLHKAASGCRLAEVGEKFGLPARSLQTQSYRWLSSGVWAEAMSLLAEAATVPAWQPDPIEIEVTLRPLAIESKLGGEERDGSMEGSSTLLELTFLTAA